MGTYVDDERIRRPRSADLYRYLVVYHPCSMSFEGNYLYLKEHDSVYVKIRGTYSYIKYHRSLRLRGGVPFWPVGAGKGNICKAYICKSCVDAVSLYELHLSQHTIKEPTIYCSIGGV